MDYRILNIKGIMIVEEAEIEKREAQFFALSTTKKMVTLFQVTKGDIELKVHSWKASQVIAVCMEDDTICPCFDWDELYSDKER